MSELIHRNLGPSTVTWDPDGTPIDLNPTHGGVIFRYSEAKAEIHEDQKGISVTNRVTVGCDLCELDVPMSNSSITQLLKAFANATPGANTLIVKNAVGQEVFSLAKEICVKPIRNGVVSVDVNEWLHIFRTYPKVNLEWPFDNSTQRVTKVVFEGYPDDYSTRVGYYWRMGPAL